MQKIYYVSLFITVIQSYTPYFFPLSHKTYLELPYVSYEIGIQHLHTPDLFLPAFGLAPINFKITDYKEPIKTKRYSIMDIEYDSILSSNSRMRFFSSKRDESTILYYEENNKDIYMIANANIKKLKSFNGHSVRIDVEIIKEKEFIKGLSEVKKIENLITDMMFTLPPTTPRDVRDPNIIKYINMINSLENIDS